MGPCQIVSKFWIRELFRTCLEWGFFKESFLVEWCIKTWIRNILKVGQNGKENEIGAQSDGDSNVGSIKKFDTTNFKI